jgi:hypothetical protein
VPFERFAQDAHFHELSTDSLVLICSAGGTSGRNENVTTYDVPSCTTPYCSVK